MNFIISLDFLIKGVLAHWQIKLQTVKKSKGKKLLENLDLKFPLLLGDQFHSMAYYIVSRMGNVDLIMILTLIEENF